MARGVWRWCSSVPEYFIIHQIFSIETKYFTWKTFTGGNPREVRLFLLAANCDSTSHWMIELLQVRSSESFYLIAVTNGLISCFRRDYFASWHWGNLSMSRLSPEQSCEPKSGLGPGRQAERERETVSPQQSSVKHHPARPVTRWREVWQWLRQSKYEYPSVV